MSERRNEIKNKISDLLMKTGERERLREFVENRLVETGWNDKVKQACKEYIRSKGVDNITVEEVVQAITPSARQIVPVEFSYMVIILSLCVYAYDTLGCEISQSPYIKRFTKFSQEIPAKPVHLNHILLCLCHRQLGNNSMPHTAKTCYFVSVQRRDFIPQTIAQLLWVEVVPSDDSHVILIGGTHEKTSQVRLSERDTNEHIGTQTHLRTSPVLSGNDRKVDSVCIRKVRFLKATTECRKSAETLSSARCRTDRQRPLNIQRIAALHQGQTACVSIGPTEYSPGLEKKDWRVFGIPLNQRHGHKITLLIKWNADCKSDGTTTFGLMCMYGDTMEAVLSLRKSFVTDRWRIVRALFFGYFPLTYMHDLNVVGNVVQWLVYSVQLALSDDETCRPRERQVDSCTFNTKRQLVSYSPSQSISQTLVYTSPSSTVSCEPVDREKDQIQLGMRWTDAPPNSFTVCKTCRRIFGEAYRSYSTDELVVHELDSLELMSLAHSVDPEKNWLFPVQLLYGSEASMLNTVVMLSMMMMMNCSQNQ
ncbi:enhancer of yellow 2 transcription factor homolog [Clonorchis sinensis]|uniref:Transcription and mRNA export factor ENY2 n=1 Tax=Clonorchis sinensis TaxID=79923 RepID=G7YHN0_CLOSI|nr:enhancer of yellow 2 transcription factor homolog [Clonorchis sinensis]